MRADADATERSGGISRDDTSALCAQSKCMALVGDNTGDAFSVLIAFPLMIAVRPQYSWSEGGINPLGNGIDRMSLHPLGLPLEGTAGQGGIHWRHGQSDTNVSSDTIVLSTHLAGIWCDAHMI
jgi:hypothetical protein